jgi:hypothetical protein
LSARFGAYEILHELKTGGMGSVLLARRRGPGTFEQLAAIKTIRGEFAGAEAVRAMFLDEAAILARLHHPRVATVHDFGEDKGLLYMVMEYVPGIAFRDLVEYRPPPIVIARAIAEACRGLHAAHELRDLSGAPLGLVHRDVSPDNLMLGFDGHVKVIDFGIALVKNRQAPVTEFGTMKGKPPYMSPEAVKNEAVDRRSDVWALAVVFWELLTQRPLFTGDSLYAIAYAVQEQTILPPSQMIGQPLPPGLDAAIMNALDRVLANRTPSAAAFAEALEQVIQSTGGETLEAWAERALVEPRDAHRTWLANVVAGKSLPKPVGRATHQVTALAAGNADTPKAPIAAAPPAVPDPPPRTSIGGTASHSQDDLSVPPRNRVAPIAIALLVLLAVGGGLLALLKLRQSTPAAPHDAAVIVLAADAAELPIDAAIDAAIPADAEVIVVPVPADAGVRRAPRDASVRVPPDAAPPPDAAVPRPTGSGLVDIRMKVGVYSTISIDGAPAKPGPMLKTKLSAGSHTIKWYTPEGELLDTQTIEVEDGKRYDIIQR